MKLLIVDQNERNLYAAEGMLAHHTLDTANTLELLIEVLESPAQFDAILTDDSLFVANVRLDQWLVDMDDLPTTVPIGLHMVVLAMVTNTRCVVVTENKDLTIKLLGHIVRDSRSVVVVDAASVSVHGEKNWLRAMEQSGLFAQREIDGK